MNHWVLASRLKTLTAAISPVLVGVSLAIHDGEFHPFIACMTLPVHGDKKAKKRALE